ncbi:MAG: NAD(P)-dependent oxidoreductase [Planctomycetota bacterium]|nr:MAG: NAD(P)-dependent oxidoreductase [Planctomycetota bacterium]
MCDLHGKRVALVGGAGFIGHNLALELQRCGGHVEIIDSLQVNNLLSVAGDPRIPDRELYLRIINERLDVLRAADIALHTQDARDYHALSRLLAEIDPQIIVHLAAVANANLSNKDPHSTFDHSLRTLENALDAARSPSLSVERFIYFSSSMVYGDFHAESVAEDAPCDPIGIYGALKLAGERMVIAYNQVFDLPYTIIRPSALYGERCVSRRVGQVFIENALRGARIDVAGDGSDRLDFTYVQDLVHGVTRVLDSPNAINETFNITFGSSRSLRELTEILAEHFPSLEVRYTPRDKLTPKRGTLCIDKARRLIGYEPQYPLERGMQCYVQWYQELTDAACAVG